VFSVLQCVALLQFVAGRCSMLQSDCACDKEWCGVLVCVCVRCLRVRVCYSVLQCVAVCCSVLQCVAVCCSQTSVWLGCVQL